MSQILAVAALGGLSWLLWLAVRNFVTISPLDKIPGPKPVSWAKGERKRKTIYLYLLYLPLYP